jgi:hypothetical protein
MTAAFGGSDADGAWDWKSAYDAGEAATVLYLHKFGRGMRARAGSCAALLGMLAKVAMLLPSHTGHSEESQALQQFSTPIATLAPGDAWSALLDGRTVLELQDGLQLRRAKVMGAFRVELTGFTDGMVERLKAMGLVSEIIAWKLRLFVPTAANDPAILGTLMERYRLVRIADRAAA